MMPDTSCEKCFELECELETAQSEEAFWKAKGERANELESQFLLLEESMQDKTKEIERLKRSLAEITGRTEAAEAANRKEGE